MKRLAATAALALLPAACSGTSSYSTTFNAADHNYAHDAVMHLRGAIAAIERAPVSDRVGAQRDVISELRVLHGELTALSGLLRSTGAAMPTVAESIEHASDHPDPEAARGDDSDAVIETVNAAAAARARSYLPKGRQPAMIATAERTIAERGSPGPGGPESGDPR